jgi:hypothetical protein
VCFLVHCLLLWFIIVVFIGISCFFVSFDLFCHRQILFHLFKKDVDIIPATWKESSNGEKLLLHLFDAFLPFFPFSIYDNKMNDDDDDNNNTNEVEVGQNIRFCLIWR